MKKGWEYKKLGEVCKTYAGGTPLKTCKEYYDGGTIPWLRSGEVCRKYIDSTELFITQKGMDNSSAKYYPVNTIVVAMYGATAAQVGILKIESTSNQAVCGILPNDRFVPEFLFYWFTYIKDFLASQAQGGAQPNISQVKIKNLTTPVPPLSEQKDIVEYLDSSFAKIETLKANAAKNLDEAKALFQSALKDALEPKEGWEEKKLKELTNKISDGSHNPPTGLSYSEYRMLSSKNVRNDNFSFDNPRYLSEDDFQKENKRTQLEKGDVLLTIVGAGLGDCCVYDFDDVIVFQRSVSVLKPNYDKITSRFLMYSMQFRYDDIRKKSNGAAQKGIYLKQLAAYSLKLPSIKEQQSIVSFLDSLNEKVNALQQNYSRICDECDALKQAILRQVFE